MLYSFSSYPHSVDKTLSEKVFSITLASEAVTVESA